MQRATEAAAAAAAASLSVQGEFMRNHDVRSAAHDRTLPTTVDTIHTFLQSDTYQNTVSKHMVIAVY